MDITNTLLALIATLVSAGVWVVKALMARSDRLIESRDEQITRALDMLTRSFEAIHAFESVEDKIHLQIMNGLEAITRSQSNLCTMIEQKLAQ